MDALLTTFLAAALAEFGDKTQWLAVLLAAHFGRPRPILSGIALAALANSALAATAGGATAQIIPFRAVTLLVALAVASAGAGAFWPAKPPRLETYRRLGAFGTSLFAFFVLEFGDKTQFLTFALAARAEQPALAAAGATAGIVAATVPAVLLGPQLAERLPLRAIRYAAGALFLLVAAACAIDALRLA